MSDFFGAMSDAISGVSDANSMAHYGSGFTPSSFQPVRALDIAYGNMLGSSYTLKDANTGQDIYRAKTGTFSEDLRFTSCIDGSDVGSVKHHTFSSKMEAVVRGRDIQVIPCRKPKDSFEYTSPAYPGARRLWRDAGASNGLDMVCLDEKGMALARMHFSNSMSSVSKYGRLELGPPTAAGGALTEEMVVIGLAIAQARMSKFVAKVVGAAT